MAVTTKKLDEEKLKISVEK